MKKQIKQKIAYALALVLGVVSIWGGTAFSLPSMRTVHAETSVTVSTAEQFQTALTGDADTIVLQNNIDDYEQGKVIRLSRQVTIDLASYTWKQYKSNEFMIQSGGNLTLIGSGNIEGGFWVEKGGEFTLDGDITIQQYSELSGNSPITIQGTAIMKKGTVNHETGSGVNVDGGTFTLNGGIVKGHSIINDAGAVVMGGGTFTMSGGTITGTANRNGGGVYLWRRSYNPNPTFNMTGGTITGCKARNGGGVYIEQGTFTITGGSITGNTASNIGGGVYVFSGATFNNNGGTISGNTANGDSSTNDIGYGSSSSSSSSSGGSGGAVVRRSSSSDDDDDDDDDDSSSSSFSSGAVRTSGSGSGKADYKKAGTNSVKYVESAVSANSKSAKVPATVKIGGKTYAVTSIGANAFKGYSKLTSMKIGRNVKRIGAGAFNGCTNLKALTINSKNIQAKNIKGAFKGSAVKTVYVPASKVQAYKNVFTKAVTGSKGKISVKAKQPSKSSKKK